MCRSRLGQPHLAPAEAPNFLGVASIAVMVPSSRGTIGTGLGLRLMAALNSLLDTTPSPNTPFLQATLVQLARVFGSPALSVQ